MAAIKKDAAAKVNEELSTKVEGLMPNLSITTSPVFICGVQRKVNIGDFENIDIYAAVALPLGSEVSLEDKEALTKAIEDAALYGFNITSTETLNRYKVVKESVGR